MSNNSYLVRGKIYGMIHIDPDLLPLRLGPFCTDTSPNCLRWLLFNGYIDPEEEPKEVPKEDKEYPISPYFVDTEINGKANKDRAEDTLNLFEAMLRLFQPGDVYVRYHEVWELANEKPTPHFWSTRDIGWTPKAEPSTLYWRDEYKIDNVKSVQLLEFFASYWPIFRDVATAAEPKPSPLYIAISRFNSSYERRTLADRLVELMIAMEALFGDNAEVTYKIALRSACMLYPQGEARKAAFDTIKQLYNERSRIIHGERLESKDEQKIAQFEDYVRSAIVKFLALCKTQGLNQWRPNTWQKELDNYLFFEDQGKGLDAG